MFIAQSASRGVRRASTARFLAEASIPISILGAGYTRTPWPPFVFTGPAAGEREVQPIGRPRPHSIRADSHSGAFTQRILLLRSPSPAVSIRSPAVLGYSVSHLQTLVLSRRINSLRRREAHTASKEYLSLSFSSSLTDRQFRLCASVTAGKILSVRNRTPQLRSSSYGTCAPLVLGRRCMHVARSSAGDTQTPFFLPRLRYTSSPLCIVLRPIFSAPRARERAPPRHRVKDERSSVSVPRASSSLGLTSRFSSM